MERRQKLPDKRATSAHIPKKKDNINDRIYITTLNVRTLRTPERETELENALEGIKFNVLGLCELRKEGENIIERANGNILYYYGKAGGQKGVGLVVNKDYKHNIEELSGISKRIAILKLKIDKINISIIQVYAPEASSEEE
jgi:exonuclease III